MVDAMGLPALGGRRSVLARFLGYGAAGWVIEVLFTGLWSAVVARDRAATAKTYLWMHPIYGATALALEWISRHLHRAPRPARIAAYVGVMYAAEYGTGAVLRRVLGRCPWDYGEGRWKVHGLIRLDYAPAWALLALGVEPARDAVSSLLGDGAMAGLPGHT